MTDSSATGNTALYAAFEKARAHRSARARRPDPRPQPAKKAAESVKNTKPAEKAKPEAKRDSAAGGRFRELIEARKAAETRLKEQEETYSQLLALGDIRTHAEEIAPALAALRLLKQGGEDRLQKALQLIDAQKAGIRKRLGMPDAGGETEAAIVESRAGMVEQTAFPQPAGNTAHSRETGTLPELIAAVESYLGLYSDEPAHAIRMRHIRQHFRDPAKISEFLDIHTPSEWPRQLKYLYENIIVPPGAYHENAAVSGDFPGEEEPLTTEALIRRNMERMGL